MRHVYRCARCGTGWLAKMVGPRGQGWAVQVSICNRCRYASQPGMSLTVEEGENALPVTVDAGLVPVARLTGPGVETLRMEEIFTLLGLLPDALGGEAQRPALELAGSRDGA
jgi:hypothetical protein